MCRRHSQQKCFQVWEIVFVLGHVKSIQATEVSDCGSGQKRTQNHFGSLIDTIQKHVFAHLVQIDKIQIVLCKDMDVWLEGHIFQMTKVTQNINVHCS